MGGEVQCHQRALVQGFINIKYNLGWSGNGLEWEIVCGGEWQHGSMFPFSKLDFHSKKTRAKNQVSVAAKRSTVHDATTFLESDFTLRY